MKDWAIIADMRGPGAGRVFFEVQSEDILGALTEAKDWLEAQSAEATIWSIQEIEEGENGQG